MKRLICALVIACLAMSLPSIGLCQQSPESKKEEAYSKIKVAQDLMLKAKTLLEQGQAGANTALQLYAQAGMLFQEAVNVLKTLGPDYVSKADIEGCDLAQQSCLDAIIKIRNSMGK